MKYVALIGILALAACSDDPRQVAQTEQATPDPTKTEFTEIEVNGSKFDIFKLPDGTQCVASWRYEVPSCNWQKSEAAQ